MATNKRPPQNGAVIDAPKEKPPMAITQLSAKTQDSAEVTFTYEIADTLQGLIDQFGEEAVKDHAIRGLVVAAQGHARSLIRSEKTAEEIQAAMTAWKPGTKRVIKSAEQKAREQIEALSPEARAQLLRDLKAAARSA